MNDPIRNDDVRQEEDRLPWLRVLLITIAALGISAMLVLGSWIVLRDRRRALRPSGRFPEAELTLEREVSAIERELFGDLGPGQRIDTVKRRELSSFSWADRDRGLVNIPIEQGMRLVVEEGGQ
jgi:hypothetical protein